MGTSSRKENFDLPAFSCSVLAFIFKVNQSIAALQNIHLQYTMHVDNVPNLAT